MRRLPRLLATALLLLPLTACTADDAEPIAGPQPSPGPPIVTPALTSTSSTTPIRCG